jgi:hypothetical protein
MLQPFDFLTTSRSIKTPPLVSSETKPAKLSTPLFSRSRRNAVKVVLSSVLMASLEIQQPMWPWNLQLSR